MKPKFRDSKTTVPKRTIPTLVLMLLVILCAGGALHAQTRQRLIADDGEEQDRFGSAVAISGKYAVIGAHSDDDRGERSGSVYVFERDDTTGAWTQMQKLTGSNSDRDDEFGYSVGISGERIIVGTGPGSSDGKDAAYIFELDNSGIWQEVQKLNSSDWRGNTSRQIDNFGRAVAISGDYALVGAYQNNQSEGAAYVFERQSDGTWQQVQKLSASDKESNDWFGFSVSISGDMAIIGAPRVRGATASAAGKIYFFKRSNNGTWQETDDIDGEDELFGEFGYAVAISNSIAIAGARSKDNGEIDNAGAAYIFKYDNTSWLNADSTKIVVSDGAESDNFGSSVAMEGTTAIIGAPFRDEDKINGSGTDGNVGAAYLFVPDTENGIWRQAQKLLPTQESSSENFGQSVAIQGVEALVGAQNERENQIRVGAAHGYNLIPLPPLSVEASNERNEIEIEIRWQDPSIDPDAEFNEEGFHIYRNSMLIFSTVSDVDIYIDPVSRDNEEVSPGSVHTYSVQIFNAFGVSEMVYDVGRVKPNGIIAGKIRAISGGAGVKDVDVCLESPLNRAISLDGIDDYAALAHIPRNDQMTISAWIRTSSTNAQQIVGWGDTSSGHRIEFAMEGGKLMYVEWDGSSSSPVISNVSINTNEWVHVCVVRENDTAELYVDGVADQMGSGVARTVETNTLAIGANLSNGEVQQPFNGKIDEVSLWDRALTAEELKANKDRLLGGNEDGLVGYWRFDAGAGIGAYDYTKNNGNATLFGAIWTDEVAPVFQCSPTGSTGNYTIRDIYYRDGTEIIIRPSGEERRFNPEFEAVQLFIDDQIKTGIDFIDESSFSINGRVKFAETVCYPEGVDILVDDVPSGTTDSDGNFAVAASIGNHTIRPFFKGHTFSPANAMVDVQGDISGLFFEDTQRYALSGGVVGGDCRFAIGEAAIFVSSTTSCFDTTFSTQPNGTYSIDLPAQDYIVNVKDIDNLDKEQIVARLQEKTISLADSNQTLDFIYRPEPEIEITGLPDTPAGCGIPVLDQGSLYRLRISVIERYDQDKICRVTSGKVKIFDNIADNVPDNEIGIDSTGTVNYLVEVGEPNILAGGEYPYQKQLSVKVEVDEKETEPVAIWAIVTGHRPREQTFVTTTPQVPLIILRDPPGDGSFSFLEEDSTYSVMYNLTIENTNGEELQGKAGIGDDDLVKGEFTKGLETTHGRSSQEGTEIVFTAKDRFSTSDDDKIVGSGGDVFIGAAFNLSYALTDVLEYDEATCSPVLSKSIGWGLNGLETEYIFSEDHIRNFLIPELEKNSQLAANPDSSERFLDDADLWRRILRGNENAKKDAQFVGDRSWDGTVGPVSYEETVENKETNSLQTFVDIDNTTAREAGLKIFGIQLNGTLKTKVGFKRTVDRDTTITRSNTIGYTLDDDDGGDQFNVVVKRDPLFNSLVFDLVGGKSSCPWEPGSLPREGVQLTLDTYEQNVSGPNGIAEFKLFLGNTSQSDETQDYELAAVPTSNPDGAKILINGISFSDLEPFTIPAGQTVQATMTMERITSTYDYENLQVMLRSLCDGQIADTATFSVHFESPCSPVTLSKPEDDWVVNQVSDNVLRVVLRDYEIENLSSITLEVSPAGLSNWTSGVFISKNSLASPDTAFNWDVSNLNDGAYKVRAAVQCSGGKTYSAIASGVIDRSPPQPFGVPQPADGILALGDEISITFNEDINCASVSSENIILLNAIDGIAIPAKVGCDGRILIITPEIEDKEIENQILQVTIQGISDLIDNSLTDAINWSFRVNRNPVFWSPASLTESVLQGSPATISAKLKNDGGEDVSFMLTDFAEWLSPVSTTSGSLPIGGEQRISLEVDPNLPTGTFTDTVIADTPRGFEPLLVTVTVQQEAPDWNIIPSAFSQSMNVIAGFYIDDVPFSEENDMVAAFVGDEVRGVAQVQKVVPQDEFAAFLTVYSNITSGESVSFRIFDASEGEERPIIETFPMVADTTYGSAVLDEDGNSQLARLMVSGAVLQSIPLADGWTWISLGVETENQSTQAVLSRLQPGEDIIIKGQTGYSQFVFGGGWVGTLDMLQIGASYRIQLADEDTLDFIGTPVPVADRPISIVPGWNWMGYLPDVKLGINEALASLDATAGDILRSQSALAQYAGAMWQGSLQFMNPGEGYILHTQKSSTLTYPGASGKTIELETTLSANTMQKQAPDWSVNAADFEHTMTITGILSIDGVPITNPNTILAAFVGEGNRGVTTPVFVLDRWLHFLTIYSNDPGETVVFMAYDAAKEELRKITESIPFVPDAIAGTPRQPFAWNTTAKDVVSVPGDVTGDGLVDVRDLITTINIILGISTPTEAEREAADLNNDGEINVTDLIVIINLILGIGATADVRPTLSSHNPATITLGQLAAEYLPEAEIYISASFSVPVSGVQFKFSFNSPTFDEIQPKLSTRTEMMALESKLDETELTVLLYSLSGKSIAAGDGVILSLDVSPNGSITNGHIKVEEALVVDKNGNELAVHLSTPEPTLPKVFSLGQNFPNPFNPSTTINYSIPELRGKKGKNLHVELAVYNLRGRLVKRLVNEEKDSGFYSVHWDGRDERGRSLASGVYIYRIRAGNFSEVKKMLVLK